MNTAKYTINYLKQHEMKYFVQLAKKVNKIGIIFVFLLGALIPVGHKFSYFVVQMCLFWKIFVKYFAVTIRPQLGLRKNIYKKHDLVGF